MTKKKSNTTELVQIIASPIPPFHQSSSLLTSCPTFYCESVIKGNKMPGGMESARGNEVHRTGASYVAYCAMKQVPMDLDAFDNLSKGAGPVAAKILSGMRESFKVDFEHIIATELPMSLDENFLPTEVVESLEGICSDSGLPAHYSGTLDALYGFREELRAEIVDLKTHPHPFDPDDTLQAKTYTVFVFAHFPWVQTVTFTLVFCRYKNVTRSVTYTRQDLPELIDALKSARERQKMIHADYDAGKELETIAGNHCIYCPLLIKNSLATDEIRKNIDDNSLSDGDFRALVRGVLDPAKYSDCPIGKYNPHMNLPPEQRLNFNLFYGNFSKANNKAMKEYVQESGRNIVLRDYNGKAYNYGPKPSEAEVYPLFKATAEGIAAQCLQCGCTLENIPHEGKCPSCGGGFVKPIMPIVDLIETYAQMSEGDTSWMGNLAISSTSFGSYLKKKDRVILHQGITDTTEKVTKVKMQVSKPLDTLPDSEFDAEEDEEF